MFGACTLESEASLLIQVVDVLLGAVRYAFHLERVGGGQGNPAKVRLMEHVLGRLGWPTLAQSHVRLGPRYFAVRELLRDEAAPAPGP